MSDKPKNTRKKPHGSFEGMPFAAMMQKMMGRQGNCCDCAEMMSQMMTTCGQAQTEEEKNTTKQPRKHKEKQSVN